MSEPKKKKGQYSVDYIIDEFLENPTNPLNMFYLPQNISKCKDEAI